MPRSVRNARLPPRRPPPDGKRDTLLPTALGAGATEPSGGESATGRITAGDDDEQKLNQDLKWRHLAGLIGRHEISTQEIVARGRAPGAGKPFGIIHSLACRAFNFKDLFGGESKTKDSGR